MLFESYSKGATYFVPPKIQHPYHHNLLPERRPGTFRAVVEECGFAEKDILFAKPHPSLRPAQYRRLRCITFRSAQDAIFI